MSQHSIYITKARQSIDVETDCLSDVVYKAALERGLKHLLSDGMSKYAVNDSNPAIQAEARRGCLTKAQDNYNKLKLGKLRFGYTDEAKRANYRNKGAKTE